MKIGLLTIATNKYVNFVENLYISAKQHFCADHEVTYYLFTNVDYKPIVDVNVKILKIDHESWPNITLKRYHSFCRYANEIEKNDYVFYSDADMLFVDSVGSEIFSDRVVTIHPGFYNKPRKLFSYENNRQSTAFIPQFSGKKYYAGGFNGGSSTDFLKMSEVIMHNVDKDLEKNIIAKWHDESHLNHYYNLISSPTLELSPSYCYPEKWNLPFPKKLLALDKNHKEYRSE